MLRAGRASAFGTQLLLLVSGVLVGGAAFAQSGSPTLLGSAQMLVTATMVNSCAVRTSAMSFGVYDPTDGNAEAPLDAMARVTVQCAAGAPVEIGVQHGTNAGLAVGTTRAMRGDSGLLGYDLYQDAAHTTPWTDRATGLVELPAERSATPRSLTVYGRIPAGQEAPPGQYMDVITITLVLPG